MQLGRPARHRPMDAWDLQRRRGRQNDNQATGVLVRDQPNLTESSQHACANTAPGAVWPCHSEQNSLEMKKGEENAIAHSKSGSNRPRLPTLVSAWHPAHRPRRKGEIVGPHLRFLFTIRLVSCLISLPQKLLYLLGKRLTSSANLQDNRGWPEIVTCRALPHPTGEGPHHAGASTGSSQPLQPPQVVVAVPTESRPSPTESILTESVEGVVGGSLALHRPGGSSSCSWPGRVRGTAKCSRQSQVLAEAIDEKGGGLGLHNHHRSH